jgi:hypothetical protein
MRTIEELEAYLKECESLSVYRPLLAEAVDELIRVAKFYRDGQRHNGKIVEMMRRDFARTVKICRGVKCSGI